MKRFAKVVALLMLISVLGGTVAFAQTRQVDPDTFSFEFYVNEGSKTRYTSKAYNRMLLALESNVTVQNGGGSVTSIQLQVWHCNMNTMVPETTMTSKKPAKYGNVYLPYTVEWVNATSYCKLAASASSVEAYISGGWTP